MNDEKGPAVPWLAIAPVLAIFGVGVAFYAYLAVGWKAQTAPTWGALGDAVGPFVAVLNVVALFAALWSVALQRHELELQRRELRETREEMKEQRAQFERTAGAQEALAKSQRDLAEAQVAANTEASMLRLAQMSQTVATLQGALATLESARMQAFAVDRVDRNVAESIERVGRHLAAEQSRWRSLRDKLGLDRGASDFGETR
jgi:hypothetical protein